MRQDIAVERLVYVDEKYVGRTVDIVGTKVVDVARVLLKGGILAVCRDHGVACRAVANVHELVRSLLVQQG